jgi:CRISPR system Cascade subunit CasA
MTFSLLDDPWIPATGAHGERGWITPADITSTDASGAPIWHDIDWGRPDLRIATYELLIGLFATALAPATGDDLIDVVNVPPNAAVLRAALAPLWRYVVIEGDGPRFQQDSEEITGDINPPDALFMDAPGANTIKNGADFFVKRGRTPLLSRKAAAIALHALQAFAPSGGAGHRTSMRGGGPLTTLVVPHRPDLWRRIAVNLPVLDRPDRRPPADLSMVFPWARAARLSRSGATTEERPEHHAHWLQHYFGMPRRIRLVFEANGGGRTCAVTGAVDEVVVTGFRMEAYGINYGVWEHPLTPYYEDKTSQVLPVHPRSGRIGYRDWVGYQFAGGDKGAVSRPALAVRTYADVLATPIGRGRVLAAGYVTDNMKTEDYVEAEVPLVSVPNVRARKLIAEATRDRLIAPAELAARQLRGALIASLDGDYQKTLIASAVERFWVMTETDFILALEAITEAYAGFTADADPDTVQEADIGPFIVRWLESFRSAALQIFREAAPLDQLGDLPSTQQKAIIDTNRYLHQCLFGRGKSGDALFRQLGLPSPEKKPPRGKPAAGVSP